MLIEITEIIMTDPTSFSRTYFHDYFIDDVYIKGDSQNTRENPYNLYKRFLIILAREWDYKYKRKYNKYLGKHHKDRH